MKLGRTITKNTPLALFARKSGLSYKRIAESTNQSESSLKKAAAGISPLPPRAALAIAERFDVAVQFLLGKTRGKKVLRWDGEEWFPFDGSVPGTASKYRKEHNRHAIIQAIEDVAAKVGYTLPSEEDQRAQIGYAVRWYSPSSTDADIAAKSPQMQQSARQLKKVYELWYRQNPAHEKSAQIDLVLYFEAKFNSAIRGYPREASKDLLARLESLLVRAGGHPQSPLIAGEILQSFIDIERRYKLSR